MTITDEQIEAAASDPRAFRRVLTIDGANGRIAPLAEVIEPWQQTDFEALDPGWRTVAGLGTEGPMRAYLERARGHSKTADLAVMVTWVLFASQRCITGLAAAADRDQSRLIIQAVERLVRLNEWLGEFLKVDQYRVSNTDTGSSMQAIAGDVGSSYGHTIDFAICDEVTVWPASGEHLWSSLVSTAAKRTSCLLAVISNSGYDKGRSWQWRTREACRQDPNWYFNSLPGSVASWISAESLAEQQRLLPPSAYRRLWGNEWITSGGDLLNEDDIQASLVLAGPMLGRADAPDCSFIGGLDLSTKVDNSSFAVIAKDRASGHLSLASIENWSPGPDGTIDLQSVQNAVLQAHGRFGLSAVLFDPFQGHLLAQQLRARGVVMTETNFAAKNTTAMASALLETFRARRVSLFNDPQLISDLQRVRIRTLPWGFKLESNRGTDGEGHGDAAIAFALAVLGSQDISVYDDDGLMIEHLFSDFGSTLARSPQSGFWKGY